MELAPVILFVYNRPWHTRQVFGHLQKNSFANQTELIIYSDGPKNAKDVDKIRKIRDHLGSNTTGFKKVTIIKRDKNIGLANSIINGTSEVINKYGKAIILEDDLITSPQFLKYINDALNYYQLENKIFSISGYSPSKYIMKIPKGYTEDVYFSPRASSWGWATWKDRWDKADWEIKDYNNFIKDRNAQKLFNVGGADLTKTLMLQQQRKIDSWAIKWCYALFKNKAYCVFPVKSLIDCIGGDGTGVHHGKTGLEDRNFDLNQNPQVSFPKEIRINKKIIKNFRKVYNRRKYNSVTKRIKLSIFRIKAYLTNNQNWLK